MSAALTPGDSALGRRSSSFRSHELDGGP